MVGPGTGRMTFREALCLSLATSQQGQVTDQGCLS